MPLSSIKQGCQCILKNMNIDGILKQKLSNMGLTPGTKLHVIDSSVGGCAVIEVRGTRLALGSNIIKNIVVDAISI